MAVAQLPLVRLRPGVQSSPAGPRNLSRPVLGDGPASDPQTPAVPRALRQGRLQGRTATSFASAVLGTISPPSLRAYKVS